MLVLDWINADRFGDFSAIVKTNEAWKNGMQTSDCTKCMNFMVRTQDETMMKIKMPEKALAGWRSNTWSICRQIRRRVAKIEVSCGCTVDSAMIQIQPPEN